MKQLTQEDILHIKAITDEFTDFILENVEPNNTCFAVCYPLSLHLKNNKITTSIISGHVKGIPHYILKLDDYVKGIIDPTIKQIYPEMPLVYVGTILQDYLHFRETYFDKIYEQWQYPLLHNGWLYPIPDEKQNQLDIKILLKIIIRTAIILNSEIKQLISRNEFIQSEPNIKYWNAIYDAAKMYSNRKKQLIEPSIMDAFDELLQEAMNEQFRLR